MIDEPNAPRRTGARDAWPSVSVVMPVRDEADHLEAAVSAVRAQDYPGDMEVVLAVAPSRDGTEGIAARLATADDGVCTGCGQQITLNMQNELKLSKLVFCRSCGRLLYLLD